MRLGINGRFLGARPTGVQRFALEVVRRLCDSPDTTLLLPRAVPAPSWARDVVVGRSSGVRWEQLELPRAAAAYDVLLHPANAGAVMRTPYVSIIHDVLPLTHPALFSRAFAAWYRLMLPRQARGASRIVTVSEWSRRELCRTLGVAPGRVRVAPQGLAPFAEPATPAAVARVRARLRLPERYLLFVGGSDPRKGLAFMLEVLDAWQQGEHAPPRLVVVGGNAPRVHGRRNSAARHDVQHIGHCDDDTLHALYTGAAALCFPSLAEGFGRPPLEALACGTPVVAAPYATAAETIASLATIEKRDAVLWAWRLRALIDTAQRATCDLSHWNWDASAAAVLAACWEAAGERAGRRHVAALPRSDDVAEDGTVSEPRHSPARIHVDDPGTATPQHARPLQRAPTCAPRRVALVHDWLTGMRGGEAVLEALLELHPTADIFTLVHVPGTVSRMIEQRVIHTSYIDRWPRAHSAYRAYLPFFPHAIEAFDLTGYDLVISTSHCVAKGVLTGDAPHLCYCHTPMRYVWDRQVDYGTALTRALARPFLQRLRAWDRATASRPQRLIANSQHVRGRIRQFWRRDATVIYPPVDVTAFTATGDADDYYVIAGALVPYKRVDLALHAFRLLGRRLYVIGDGPDYARLKRIAPGNVTFTGHVSRAELSALLARARALVMPMVEDFGIIAVEAQAAGTPVIALAAGGALETVIDVRTDPARGTGMFFREQTPSALADTVLAADACTFRTQSLHTNAARFGRDRFRAEMQQAVDELVPTGTLV